MNATKTRHKLFGAVYVFPAIPKDSELIVPPVREQLKHAPRAVVFLDTKTFLTNRVNDVKQEENEFFSESGCQSTTR